MKIHGRQRLRSKMKVIRIIPLFFITGCAGFYTSQKSEPVKISLSKEIFVNTKVNFIEDEKVLDEIAVKNTSDLNKRAERIKKYLNDFLTEVSMGKMKEGNTSNDSQCSLEIFIKENYSVKDTLPSALTLGLWPYLGSRKLLLRSELKINSRTLHEVESTNSYNVGFALIFAPFALFKPVYSAEEQAYIDLFKNNLRKVNFSECSK